MVMPTVSDAHCARNWKNVAGGRWSGPDDLRALFNLSLFILRPLLGFTREVLGERVGFQVVKIMVTNKHVLDDAFAVYEECCRDRAHVFVGRGQVVR